MHGMLGKNERSFNSQPRKGADDNEYKVYNLEDVSTHSPARGLTGYRLSQHLILQRFNSQPRKGADSKTLRIYE